MHKETWQQTGEALLSDLHSSPQGLTGQEAAQRLEKYGPNELREGGKKSTLRIFLEQFMDFLVIILIAAAAVSAVLGDVESMVVILAVITMNAVLGTVQTVKAEASLDSLKQMSAPPQPRSCGTGRSSRSPAGRWSPATSSSWRPVTPSAPTAACWSPPA